MARLAHAEMRLTGTGTASPSPDTPGRAQDQLDIGLNEMPPFAWVFDTNDPTVNNQVVWMARNVITVTAGGFTDIDLTAGVDRFNVPFAALSVRLAYFALTAPDGVAKVQLKAATGGNYVWFGLASGNTLDILYAKPFVHPFGGWLRSGGGVGTTKVQLANPGLADVSVAYWLSGT